MELNLRLDYICVDKQVPSESYQSEDAFNRSWRAHPFSGIELIYADYELNNNVILSFKITKGPAYTWKISHNNKLIDQFTCSEQNLFLTSLKESINKNLFRLQPPH